MNPGSCRRRSRAGHAEMSRRLAWVLLAACAALAFAAFAYPMYVIRPFRAQSARELAAALAVRSWGPPVATAAAIVALLLSAFLWRTTRRASMRALSTLATLPAIAFAALAHVNVYEIMFHRIDSPQTVSASEAKLDGDDMVLAIHQAGHARAYPIRMIAYHHIVNDRLGDLPVVSTY